MCKGRTAKILCHCGKIDNAPRGETIGSTNRMSTVVKKFCSKL